MPLRTRNIMIGLMLVGLVLNLMAVLTATL